MMTYGQLPFQYSNEISDNKLTSFAGLPLYMELAIRSGLCQAISEKLQLKKQGWSDLQILMAILLLNIAGGDCVDDIERLENDEGLRVLLLRIETYGMKRKARREVEKRWRKSKQRTFPSASALLRYLKQFHDVDQESQREAGTAFIPARSMDLQALEGLNATLIAFAQQQTPSTRATLDQDATLAATHKRSAFYCYKKYKAYQPFNTYWAEQGMVLSSEFRDGNVPAGFEQCRVLQESLAILPDGVKEVYLRSDSAGYQQALLEYCAEGQNERFGVIKFAISARVSQGFKKAVAEVKEADWEPVEKCDEDGHRYGTSQEWAEVCYVPDWVSNSKGNPDYRFIAIREPMVVQTELDLEGQGEESLPFQTLDVNKRRYKLFGVVTNRKLPGNELINWHRRRCGASEKIHHVEKSELAGGQFPSQAFGANAAWWQIMVLALNLNHLLKRLVLPKKLKKKGLKGLRFQVIQVAGRVISHARGLTIKLSGGQETVDRLCGIRERIMELGNGPPLLSSG